MSLPLGINPNKVVSIKLVGAEQTPVIVIDDVLLRPALIETDACSSNSFTRDEKGFYPGARSSMPKDYIIEILRATYQQIAQIYKVPTALQLKPQAGYYSLVTKAESALSTLQRIPHFDAVQPYYFALLLYVNPRAHGGTGFFRDNTTQFERITRQKEQHYLDSAAHYINHVASPQSGYICDSTQQFTLIEHVDYRPNRLVIYPGNLLHSGLINPQTDISLDPEQGRLTANIFIDFK